MSANRLVPICVAVLTGVGAGVAIAPSARAVTCLSSPYNTTDEASANGRGNRANDPGMTVYNGVVECARVSSLFVKNATETKFVEIGWFEDSSDPNWNYTCLDNTTGPPRIFTFVDNAGMSSCHTGAALADGDIEKLAVHDQDQDGEWKFFRSGDLIYTSPDMGSFNAGLTRTNGERTGTADSARSEFDGLDRMDATGTWVDWGNPFEAATSDDPDYKDCIDSGDDIRVIGNSTAC